jgi:hypothetical protein
LIGGRIEVGILIREGTDINAAGGHYNGRMALTSAAEEGRLDVMEVLLRDGAGVHAVADRMGRQDGFGI